MGFYYDFEDADAFATGAIGHPGDRTFYLQIRGEGRTISVKCEKQQVAALAEYLRNMLADMPEVAGSADIATAALQSPVEQDFVLGSVGLGVDRPNMRMVVQLEEMVLVEEDDDDIFDLISDDDEDEDPSTVVRVLLTPAQARAFCDTADLFITAGREECKWCGTPINPSGHACPRFN
jgi:uncharacterized repeat protein (TIGR03847 family)